MIREAEMRDIPALMEMATALHEQTVYREIAPLVASDLMETFRLLIGGRNGSVLVRGETPTALFALNHLPLFFNKRVMGAQELFWYVEPEHRGVGLRFLKDVENWLRGRGMMFLCVAGAEGLDPRLDLFYRRAGYRLVETHYVKVF